MQCPQYSHCIPVSFSCLSPGLTCSSLLGFVITTEWCLTKLVCGCDLNHHQCNNKTHTAIWNGSGTNNDENKAAKTKEAKVKLDELKEEYTHVGNGTYLSGNWTLLDENAKEVDETDIVLAETFHDVSNNRTWIREDFKDGHEIEEWNGEALSQDDDSTSSYQEPLPNLAVTLWELFGWEAHEEEEAKAEEEKEKTRYLRRVGVSVDDEDAVAYGE